MWKAARLMTLVSVFVTLVSSCGFVTSDSDDYYNEYLEEREKAKKLLHQNYESDMALVRTQRLFNQLDDIAEQCKKYSSRISLSVLSYQISKTGEMKSLMESDLNLLRTEKDNALTKISEIEKRLAETNLERLLENVPLIIKEDEQEGWSERLRGEAASYSYLSGLRSFFTDLERSSEDQVAKVLGSVPAAVATAPTTPSYTPSSVGTGDIQGTVFAPNGMDPISKALVYAPHKGNESLKARVFKPGETAALDCGEPTESYLAKTCSEPTGKFTLKTLPSGDVVIRVKKGSFVLASTTRVKAGETVVVPRVDTTLPSQDSERGTVAKIAVVQGSFDKLEQVLAKIGLAEVRNGVRVAGTEKFDLYDVNQARMVFRDAKKLAGYNLVMINCGIVDQTILDDGAAVAGLRAYVRAGGRLYVTDQAYDIVEQIFPDKIRFANDSSDTEPGILNHAQAGKGGEQLMSTIKSLSLERWLRDGVWCGLNDKRQNCLTGNQIHIQGFSGQWAQMDRVKGSGVDPAVWLEADVEGVKRPLTVTFSEGRGKVLYSSYHTFHGGATGYIYPQERVLQYFVFEMVN